MADRAREACVFCRIAGGDVPAEIVGEGEAYVAFRDLNPQAPTHVLVIPRVHVPSLDDLGADDPGTAGALLLAAQAVARDEGLVEGGYRVVVNTGSDGGQSVDHLHLHVLGGRAMTWPPG